MRIHTKLALHDMHTALKNSAAPISFESISEHGSRTHEHAFEVALTGSSPYAGGMAHADYYQAATWDEWGAFFGALYDLDPDARCGGSVKRPTYANADDYHYKTGDRFHPRPVFGGWTYLPADTHDRHRWEFDAAGFQCTKCSAHRPRVI